MTGAPQICLWSIIGKNDPLLLDRTLRVMRYCNSFAAWRHKLLFTVVDPSHYTRVDGLRVQQIPMIEDRSEWQIFIGRTVSSALVGYPYSLCVHDDGFPLDLEMWHPKFFDYDYVAAPWNYSGLVGSGGCSLSSSRFNMTINQLSWYDGKTNFDEWACRIQRQRLLEMGIKFPSPEIAACFCTETTDNEKPSFAYHGRNHAVEKHKLAWEKLEAWEKEAGWTI